MFMGSRRMMAFAWDAYKTSRPAGPKEVPFSLPPIDGELGLRNGEPNPERKSCPSARYRHSHNL